jgi:uncharacterized membrane-anchored protein
MLKQNSIVDKVPHITLAFWIIKICATTLGETGGDAVSMTLGLGYLASTAFFMAAFIVVAVLQIRSKQYHPYLYWLVILATTTAGTTLSDFLDRTAGLGYIGGSALLLVLLGAVLLVWRLTLGRIVFEHVVDPRAESFYWVTILISNTLGTALGDYTADDLSLGFIGGAVLFASLIAVVYLLYRFTKISRVALFWAAFILTRPLGATLGDTLTKPLAQGGFNLGTFASSAVLAVAIVLLVWGTSRRQRADGHA